MGDSGGQTSGGGKLLDFQHATFDLQLLDAPERRQVAEHGNCESHLATLIVNLAGARIVFDFLLRIGIA